MGQKQSREPLIDHLFLTFQKQIYSAATLVDRHCNERMYFFFLGPATRMLIKHLKSAISALLLSLNKKNAGKQKKNPPSISIVLS